MCLAVALEKVREGGLEWGWIGFCFGVFQSKVVILLGYGKTSLSMRERLGIWAWWGWVVEGDGSGFGQGKGHQWTLFAWIYA